MSKISRRDFLKIGGTAALVGAWAKLSPLELVTSAQVTGGELRVAPSYFAGNNNAGDLASLDPARRGNWSFHSLLWSQLVAITTDGTPIPERSVADSWEISDDGTVYTFNIRDNAMFSDGTPITAQAIVDGLGYLAMMNHGEARGVRDNFGSARRLLFDVVGMLEFTDQVEYNPFGTGPVEGIKALDERTVEITLEAPSINFLARLGVAFAVFNPADMLAGADAEYGPSDFWTSSAVNSGPYKLVEAVPGESYVMEPNENYFGPMPQVERITCLAVSQDMNTVLIAFANEQVDLVSVPLNGSIARQAIGDPQLSQYLVEVPEWRVEQFWMTPNVPLDDVHVRRAISMAFDRESLINVLNSGVDLPLHRPVNMHRSPNVPHCIDETAEVTMLPFDPEAAKAELAMSKYGEDVVNMELHVLSQNPQDLVSLEVFKAMMEQNLGWTNVTLHTEQVPDMMNPPFPLHFWYNTQQPWYPDITDTLQNMVFLMRDEPWEDDDHRPFVTVGYEPELKDLVEAAIAENDSDARCALVQEAGQLWNDVALSLDFGIPVSYYLVSDKVNDIEFYGNAGQGKPINVENVTVES
jgi:ABC-type transport system substrate-binding protein